MSSWNEYKHAFRILQRECIYIIYAEYWARRSTNNGALFSHPNPRLFEICKNNTNRRILTGRCWRLILACYVGHDDYVQREWLRYYSRWLNITVTKEDKQWCEVRSHEKNPSKRAFVCRLQRLMSSANPVHLQELQDEWVIILAHVTISYYAFSRF